MGKSLFWYFSTPLVAEELKAFSMKPLSSVFLFLKFCFLSFLAFLAPSAATLRDFGVASRLGLEEINPDIGADCSVSCRR